MSLPVGLLGVLLLYYALRPRAQLLLLIVVSLVFYAWLDGWFVLLAVAIAAGTFVTGLFIGASDEAGRRRWLIAGVLFNVGVLVIFKYLGLLVASGDWLLRLLRTESTLPLLQWGPRLAISFMVFNALSYLFDLWRGRSEPIRDCVTFVLFICYFPHLVAGPILRTNDLLPQLGHPRVVTGDMIISGLLLMGFGLYKKLVLADQMTPHVERVFEHADVMPWSTLLRGAWLFALQLYADFSGYTDIARGCSRLFGIELPENFRWPLLATSVRDFWQRWHMTLSTWWRDYLYIPLGGSRRGGWITCRNVMITMIIAGLWHGAEWTFVLWGALHGLLLVVGRLWRSWCPAAENKALHGAAWAGAVLGTFAVLTPTWVLFRAKSIGVAADYLRGLCTLRGGLDAFALSDLVLVVAFGGLVLLTDWLKQPDEVAASPPSSTWPTYGRGILMGLLAVHFILAREDRETAFIYARF
ncbi:MAG: MBOAT family protein [Verrucomicrobia bacterium]|nr:MBOAT family protein [Verrucomicrobiota bacterium]